MKISRICITLLMIVWVFSGSDLTVRAGPPPVPYGPKGTVRVNGQIPPDGTQVTAWIGGVRYASTATYTWGSSIGYYSIDVPGDLDETPDIKEGGREGETVVFKVDGRTASPTGTWTSGDDPVINLTVTIPPTATPTHTATPITPTNTPTHTRTPTRTNTPTITPTSGPPPEQYWFSGYVYDQYTGEGIPEREGA